MASFNYLDGNGHIVEISAASGSGTSADPYVLSLGVASLVPGTGATSLGKAEDAAHTTGDVGVMMLGVRKDTAAALAGTDADYIPLIVNASGKLWVDAEVTVALPTGTNSIGSTKDNGPHWTTVFGVSSAVVTSADASGTIDITDAPTSGQKLVITDILFSTDTALRADFKCETTGTIVASGYFAANCGIQQLTPRSKLKLATADKKLRLTTSAAGNIRCTVFYYSEA